MILTVELNDEQILALQLAQYRNGESLSHTLLRLAKLAPEPCTGFTHDFVAAQIREDLTRAGDARLFQTLESLAETETAEVHRSKSNAYIGGAR